MKILKRTGIKTYLSSAPECPYKGGSKNKPSMGQQGFLPSTVALLILLATASLANAATITVSPGQSIQAAVDSAAPGDIIQVRPGIYHDGAPGSLNAVTVTKNAITLLGLSRPGHPVVLENAGGQQFGIWTSPADSIGPAEEDYEFPPCATSGATVENFTLTGFTLRGFDKHGVHLSCVSGFNLSNNVADGNDEYGLFPLLSEDGVIANNIVRNTQSDAAIYVGQSTRVSITGNVVESSLIGIEIENSTDSVASANALTRNTIGILVDLLPFHLVNVSANNQIVGNTIINNNRPNTADPDDITAAIPSGTGILILGSDTTTTRDNVVRANSFTGIGVASFCTAMALAGQSCDGIDIDPDPDGNQVTNNVLSGNGLGPPYPPEINGLRADFTWDGSGTGNCWSGNRFRTSVPSPLPACL